MENRYYLYDVEMLAPYQGRMSLVLETNDAQEAYSYLAQMMLVHANMAKNYQLQEREDTGVYFVRVNIVQDGRPFCKKPEDMGPDKLGYYGRF
jgi:tartrate dehydratase alpha subunit/fumarate hydratase class I-like protein